MRNVTGIIAGAIVLASCGAATENTAVSGNDPVEQRNKETARAFYEELWFSENTDAYSEFVADEYVVHDIGDRKNVTEPAIEQKNVADLFHSFGDLSGEIDWQMADGDMVATRWTISLDASPEAAEMGMTSVENVPIINVFRFNPEGKIVEIWNHRHDIDLPQPPGPPPENIGAM